MCDVIYSLTSLMVCSLPVDPLRGSQLMVYSVALRVVLVAAMAVGNGDQG